MKPLAQRLMLLDQLSITATNQPSSIFGAGISLAQDIQKQIPFRIGLWPCVSDVQPENAMGLWTVLAFLLEQPEDVRVYRVFAHLDDENPDNFVWKMGKSQFIPDDWGIDALDENIAIWGHLGDGDADGQLQLKIFVENDLSDDLEDDDITELNFEAKTISEIINRLPDIANAILRIIDAGLSIDIDQGYETHIANGSQEISEYIYKLFQWELHLLLVLWGREWDDDEIIDQHQALIAAAQKVNHDFAGWGIAQATSRAMLPGLSIVGDLLIPIAPKLVSTFHNSSTLPSQLALALYNLGYMSESINLLELAVQTTAEDSPVTWTNLAMIYQQSSSVHKALDAFQRAIENDAVDADLYFNYGNLLGNAYQNDTKVEEFILVDPDEFPKTATQWEAIEAYEEALSLDEFNTSSLYRQCVHLMTLDLKRFWEQFKKLIVSDKTGEYIGQLLEIMYILDDIQPAINSLKEAINTSKNRIDLYLNLAEAYLLNDDLQSANQILQKAKTQAGDTSSYKDEIARLLLITNNPDFERRIGEIGELLDAGKSPSSEDVDFLENILEQAPSLVQVIILLTKAYIKWEEGDTALEVLLDAQKRLPNDAQILDTLAAVLWGAGQHELSFRYLMRGLEEHPNSASLLARTGLYLFINGQHDKSKSYIARAEAIQPRNPILRQAKVYIASKLSNSG